MVRHFSFVVQRQTNLSSLDAKNRETIDSIEAVKARNEALRREIEALQNMPVSHCSFLMPDDSNLSAVVSYRTPYTEERKLIEGHR